MMDWVYIAGSSSQWLIKKRRYTSYLYKQQVKNKPNITKAKKIGPFKFMATCKKIRAFSQIYIEHGVVT